MEILQKDRAAAYVKPLEKLCQLRPNSFNFTELAKCYFTTDRPKEALPLIQMAWDKNREPSIGMNYGLILKDLGRHDESLKIMEETYYLNSDDFYIRMGYSEGLLKAGHWRQAWPLYDNCRLTQQGAAADLSLPNSVREWNGETLPEGHTLLVINEGGTGDRISYPRWLPELTKRGINWVFFPYAELWNLFEKILPRERLVKDEDDINPTHWTTSFALPAKLNCGPTEVPPPLKFVALPETIEKYKINRPDNLPVVGICYEAAELFQGGRKVRSLSEGQAMRLVSMTGNLVHWVSLQHGKPMPYPVTNLPIETWEDTAGVISNLDAVVSVDTGVMHLAGALGKKMAVILSANSCWKFLRTGKKLNLYPTATFYRNTDHGMEEAVTELIAAIRNNSAW